MTEGPVLLTGATGLLGHWLMQTVAPDRELIAVTHTRPVSGVRSFEGDLRVAGAIDEIVSAVHPSLVIHAAYAKDRASIVDATRNLVQAAGSTNATVAFTSTDAVFLGDGVDRDELSPPDAPWDYGRWKAEAEHIVMDQSAENIVIRLPLLVSMGPDGHMVKTIREGLAAGSSTKWYQDEQRQPALAAEVADAIWRITDLPQSIRCGYWHLPGPEALSRFEIAQRLINQLDLPHSSITASLQPTNSDRPPNISLSDERARTYVNWNPTPIG